MVKMQHLLSSCWKKKHVDTCCYITCFLLWRHLLTLLQIIYSRTHERRHAYMPRRRKCLVVSVMLLTNPALLSEIIEPMTVCQVACICHIQGPVHSHALNEQFYTYASKFWNNIAKAKAICCRYLPGRICTDCQSHLAGTTWSSGSPTWLKINLKFCKNVNYNVGLLLNLYLK